MLRTWPVRLEAMEFTLSVRSFQVPATPRTVAWPPSLPSVPTSRATRVTSSRKAGGGSTLACGGDAVFFVAAGGELVGHRVEGGLGLEDFAAGVDRHLLGQVPLRDRRSH